MPASSVEQHRRAAAGPAAFGLLVVSDRRTSADDDTTPLARRLIEAAGHQLTSCALVPNREVEILRMLRTFGADESIGALVVSGGTGLSPRDRTVEAIAPLFERRIEGFGELFRALSYAEIGSAAMMSRADAGVIANRPVFLLPGSPDGVLLALERLILPEIGHLIAQLKRPV